MASISLTSEELTTMLPVRYPSPEWVFIPQLPDGTGSAKGRTADGLAFNTWPSRGLDIHGFEIKSYRGDWLRELKRPEKADAVAVYCDYWWIVAGSADIVKLDELPSPWGLLIPRGKNLFAVKPATKMDATPINREFFAGIARRLIRSLDTGDAVEQARRDGYRDGRVQGDKEAARDLEHARHSLRSLEEGVKQFESASGVKFEYWNAGKIGSAVKLLMDGERTIEQTKEEVERLRDRLGKLLEEA